MYKTLNQWQVGLLKSVFILGVALLGGLFGGSSVSAASPDELIQPPVSQLTLSDGLFTEPVFDYSTNWSQLFNPSHTNFGDYERVFRGNGNPEDAWTAFNDRLAEGNGWTVTQYFKSIRVTVIDGTGCSATIPEWNQWDEYNLGTTCGGWVITVNMDENWKHFNVIVDYQWSNLIHLNWYDKGYENPYIINVPIVYPPNYNGIIPPDSAGTPQDPFEPVFDLYYNFDDKNIMLQDNSNYIGLNAEECWIQAPNNKQGDNFNEYYYDCYNPPMIEHEVSDLQSNSFIIFARRGSEIKSQTFTLNMDGGKCDSVTGCEGDKLAQIFDNCMNGSFPFIHFNECRDSFGYIFGLLSFDRLKFGNAWEHVAECKELAVLDDWIHLENPEVCPMFSSTVRNTVTPFVTLALGLVTLGFVTRQSGSGF